MFKLREAKVGDEAGIARLNVACWKESFIDFIPHEILNAFSYDKRKNYWAECLKNSTESNKIILATSETEEIIGFQYIGIPMEPKYSKFGEMIGLNVYKKYQNFGVGKSLFKHGLNCLYNAGYQEVIGWVLEKNIQALKFFEMKMGGKYFDYGEREILKEKFNQICLIWKKKL